jgi:hypothetical protein
VPDILQDAFSHRYNGGIYIEPHMVVGLHDAASKVNDDVLRKNFIEYGRRLQKLIAEVR